MMMFGILAFGVFMLMMTHPEAVKERIPGMKSEKTASILTIFKDHPTAGLLIAFALLPFLVGKTFGLTIGEVWSFHLLPLYGMVLISSAVLAVALRMKGDTGRALLTIAYSLLSIFCVVRIVAGALKLDEPYLQYVEKRKLDAAGGLAPASLPPFTLADLRIPPYNDGDTVHQYKLGKGWNQTLLFKRSWDEDFFLYPDEAEVIVRFQGYEGHAPESVDYRIRTYEEVGEHTVPTAVNGRLYVYSPIDNNVLEVRCVRGSFQIQPDQRFQHKTPDPNGDVFQGPAGSVEAVLRKPGAWTRLSSFSVASGDTIYYSSSGPFRARIGGRLGTFEPEVKTPIVATAAGTVELQPMGAHDTFVRFER